MENQLGSSLLLPYSSLDVQEVQKDETSKYEEETRLSHFIQVQEQPGGMTANEHDSLSQFTCAGCVAKKHDTTSHALTS